MDLESVQRRIAALQSDNDVRLGQAQALAREGKALIAAQEQAQQTKDVLDRAVAVLNSVSEQRAQEAQRAIESLVTRGLQSVFGSDLSFHITSAVKGKAVTSSFVIRTELPNGDAVDTPVMDSRGGGLAATVGVLLRIVLILLDSSQPRLLVLDETFSHVSAEYEAPLAEFLADVARQAGIQIIMVTHSEAYVEVADTVYRFAQQGGRTVAAKVRSDA